MTRPLCSRASCLTHSPTPLLCLLMSHDPACACACSCVSQVVGYILADMAIGASTAGLMGLAVLPSYAADELRSKVALVIRGIGQATSRCGPGQVVEGEAGRLCVCACVALGEGGFGQWKAGGEAAGAPARAPRRTTTGCCTAMPWPPRHPCSQVLEPCLCARGPQPGLLPHARLQGGAKAAAGAGPGPGQGTGWPEA